MIIQRILNNNVVIVKNKKGQEEIVCGKGIAFKKKVGEFVDVSAINKVFTLRGRKELEYFQELWEEIPVEYFKVADYTPTPKAENIKGHPPMHTLPYKQLYLLIIPA